MTRRALVRVLLVLVSAGVIALAFPPATASAALCTTPGEIYCTPGPEVQLSADPATCDSNIFATLLSNSSCATQSNVDNGNLGTDIPNDGGNFITSFVMSGVTSVTQMIQTDAQLMTTFILVDQMSGQNTSTNPVLICEEAQDKVLAACAGKGEWFLGQYSLMYSVALYIVLPLFLLMVIQSIFKGSLFLLLKNSIIMFPLAVLGALLMVNFMQLLLNITDDFCNYIVDRATVGLTVDTCKNSAGQTVTSASCGLRNSLVERSFGSSGLFIAMFWSVVLLFASVAIYLEMLGRHMGIYAMTLLLPLAMAGIVWPRSISFAKRMIQYEIALIISKVFIVAALSLGMSALANTRNTQLVDGTTAVQSNAANGGIQAYAAGALIVMLAAFAGSKVASISPAAMAGQMPVWNKGAIWSRGQGIAAIQQRINQFNKWRTKNRPEKGSFSNMGPKGGKDKGAGANPVAGAPPPPAVKIGAGDAGSGSAPPPPGGGSPAEPGGATPPPSGGSGDESGTGTPGSGTPGSGGGAGPPVPRPRSGGPRPIDVPTGPGAARETKVQLPKQPKGQFPTRPRDDQGKPIESPARPRTPEEKKGQDDILAKRGYTAIPQPRKPVDDSGT